MFKLESTKYTRKFVLYTGDYLNNSFVIQVNLPKEIYEIPTSTLLSGTFRTSNKMSIILSLL